MYFFAILFIALFGWAVFQEIDRQRHKRRVERNYREYKKMHQKDETAGN
jgi:uncharacterized membrane protein YiaA